MTSLDIVDLPNDMLYEIFNRLDIQTLKDVSMVCKLFNNEIKHILETKRKLRTIFKTWQFLSTCSHWERVIVFEGEQQISFSVNSDIKTTVSYDGFVFVRPMPIRSI